MLDLDQRLASLGQEQQQMDKQYILPMVELVCLARTCWNHQLEPPLDHPDLLWNLLEPFRTNQNYHGSGLEPPTDHLDSFWVNFLTGGATVVLQCV